MQAPIRSWFCCSSPFEGRAILTLLQDREVAVEVEGFHPDLTKKQL